MPDSSAVIWTTALALIVTMLAIIGYLINKGFDGMKASIEKQFEILWKKLNEYQKISEANTAEIQAHKEAGQERRNACDERYKRLDGEIVRLNVRIGDRRNAE